MNLVKKRVELKTVIKSSIERHPVPVLGIDYKVKIEYKNIKIAELDVEQKTIKISLVVVFSLKQNINTSSKSPCLSPVT